MIMFIELEDIKADHEKVLALSKLVLKRSGGARHKP
jgi:hypothetical protein